MIPKIFFIFYQEKTFKLTSKLKNKYIYICFFLLNFSHVCGVGVDPPDMEALLGWHLRPASSSWEVVYLVLLKQN